MKAAYVRWLSAAIVLQLCAATVGLSASVAPGVEYTTYAAPGPNRVYVVSVDLSRAEYKLRMGFAKAKRNYSAREATSTIASRYDSPPSFDVLAAVNGSRFNYADIGITGLLADSGNSIQNTYSERETYMFTDARWSQIKRGISGSATITPANGNPLTIDQLNLVQGVDKITVYTPVWDSSTRTTVQGTEVVLTGVSYPLRPNKTVSGVVSAVRTGAQSLNNAIPANGLVMSASGTRASELSSRFAVGDRVSLKCSISKPEYNNAQLMVTGAGWILRGGAAYTSNWSNYPQSDQDRNPRTVIAWNATTLFLVVIDGRQQSSVGMTFQETADFLTGTLAATDAINMDGGGSSAMVVDGSLKNVPSEGAQRAVANAIMLVKQDTSTTYPLVDSFPSTGRTLAWDDKLFYCPVQQFSPASPGGDGYALVVMDPGAAVATTHVGDLADTDYAVESDIYCEYRPSYKERYAIFARDNGNFALTSSSYGGGNCYLMAYESKTGSLRIGKSVNGVLVDLAPISYLTSSAWHKMRIETYGINIRYYLDGKIVASIIDTSFARGFAGIGYDSLGTSQAYCHGTRADNFRLLGAQSNPDAARAKSMPVGFAACLSDAVVTAAFPQASLFYVKSGVMSIGVAKNGQVPDYPVVGQHVTVMGPTGRAAAPYASEMIVQPATYTVLQTTSPVKPLSMTNRASGGGAWGLQLGVYDDAGAVPGLRAAGLNTVGGLITLCGTVIRSDAAQHCCWIDDGSGLYDGVNRGVRVDLSSLGGDTPLATGFYAITGILRGGCFPSISSPMTRVLWPRSAGDVRAIAQ